MPQVHQATARLRAGERASRQFRGAHALLPHGVEQQHLHRDARRHIDTHLGARELGANLHHNTQIAALLTALRQRGDIPVQLYATAASTLATICDVEEQNGVWGLGFGVWGFLCATPPTGDQNPRQNPQNRI